MDALQTVRKLLTLRKREDIAILLRNARLSLVDSDNNYTPFGTQSVVAIVHLPIVDYVSLTEMPEQDLQLVRDAVKEVHRPTEDQIAIIGVDFYVDKDQQARSEVSDEELIQDLEQQKALIISVSTGGPRIQTVNEQYKDRCQRIRSALRERGLEDPNPHSDLWEWYGKWSSGDLPTYQSRRQYVAEMYSSLLERLRRGTGSGMPVLSIEPTGWIRLDRNVDMVRRQLAEANNEEQFQTVGLLCREAFISLAQAVYDPARHPPVDGTVPSKTDAKRMLECYIAVELAGGPNEQVRHFAKSALDLANSLQHSRTATFRDAAACAEVTTCVVNLIAIISGRRDAETRS